MRQKIIIHPDALREFIDEDLLRLALFSLEAYQQGKPIDPIHHWVFTGDVEPREGYDYEDEAVVILPPTLEI